MVLIVTGPIFIYFQQKSIQDHDWTMEIMTTKFVNFLEIGVGWMPSVVHIVLLSSYKVKLCHESSNHWIILDYTLHT